MKFPPLPATLIVAGFLAAPAFLSAQPAAAPLGPMITFLTNEYDFGKINMGQQVNHIFVVSNSGDQTLVISNVAPGCHCTTARDWTHRIEPGMTGDIPIKFDSGGIHGTITRTITVTSNGKNAPAQTLFLRGTVWQEIELVPQTAYMAVQPDSDTPSTAVVHIINRADTPLTLSDPTSVNGMFKAEVKPTVPGKEFDLTVTAIPPFPAGNNIGNISVKTTSSNMPTLIVTVVAAVQPTINVTPMQIVLLPEILGWTTNSITITSNSKKPLVLSDLEVCCDQSIKAEIKEISPGRVFQVVVAVPPGFKTVPGQRPQVSVKSNSADKPVITVPITQYPRSPISPLLNHPKVMSQAPPPAPAPGHP